MEKINLEQINDPSFIKKLTPAELEELVKEIRTFILEKVSKNGGHLSSNLGTVELIVAMHYIFDCKKDKFIFDVSHQAYTHKILTGRAKDFDTLRKFGGLSGFANYKESEYDVWESGHSSTSLAAQCGFLLARKDPSEKVVALIGNASIMNGVSFEALNYMGNLKGLNPIIILNDNNMSISPSVGAVSRSLSHLRSSKAYQKVNNFFARHTPTFVRNLFHRLKKSLKGFILQENLFEDFGFDYMGPYDGNNLAICIKSLRAAKMLNKPCVIHFVTKKGKGYKFAEDDKIGIYHGVGPFDLKEGVHLSNAMTFSKAAAETLLNMRKEKEFYVITPAMIRGSELEEFEKAYPSSLLDVGIAEELAAVVASSMVKEGSKCILMLYSTFAQRAYDYLLNDIARSNIPVLMLIDRADIVPGDGETHQGIYDISMFSAMPNVEIYQPHNGDELNALINYSYTRQNPIVIRYNKGKTVLTNHKVDLTNMTETVVEGRNGYIITYGENVNYIQELMDKNNLDYTLINMRKIHPFDRDKVDEIIASGKPLLVYENCAKSGSLGMHIGDYLIEKKAHNHYIAMAIKDSLNLPCGSVEELRKFASLAEEDIIKAIKNLENM